MRPLHGPDAVILGYLIRLCRYGQINRTFTTADVQRVCGEHLQPRLVNAAQQPKPAPRKKRRQQKPREYPPPPPGPPQPVDLTPQLARVLGEMREGNDVDEIAAHLHVSRATANNHMTLVARKVGGVDRHHALRLVEAGAVEIHVKQTQARKQTKGKAA